MYWVCLLKKVDSQTILKLYLIKFYLYGDSLTLCQLQKREHIFELMLARVVAMMGLCLNALYEVNLTDCLGFLVSTENTGHCLVHPKPVARLAKSPVLNSLFAPRVHSGTHISRSPSLSLSPISMSPSYRSQMNLSAAEHVS